MIPRVLSGAYADALIIAVSDGGALEPGGP